MTYLIKKYFTWLAVFSLTVFIAGVFVFYYPLSEYYLPVYLLVLLFFVVITGGMHFILLSASNKNPSKFNNYFLIATTVKLIIYMIFIMVYLYLNRKNAIPFLLVFFITYLLYTTFESISITRQIRKK